MSPSLEETYLPFLQTVSFAARAHRTQLRKDRETPYVSHVFRVCLIVRDLFGVADHRVLMAALLHDTVEDTLVDFDDLAKEFGLEIAKWVAQLTKDKRQQENQREKDHLQQLRQAPWQVQVCKLADILDNLLDAQNLPPPQRQRALERYRQYLRGFPSHPHDQVQRPLQLVQQLLAEMAGQTQRKRHSQRRQV